ncbi:MAG: hypothetical protein VKJ06_07435 [Vampirovibrionales bacterium]|nr:hypothetical protein [Vampirovibrionales bacterium]
MPALNLAQSNLSQGNPVQCFALAAKPDEICYNQVMILDAFSEQLKQKFPGVLSSEGFAANAANSAGVVKYSATAILCQWLLDALLSPPTSNIIRVIHAEIGWRADAHMLDATVLAEDASSIEGAEALSVGFYGKSVSGRKLLKTLWHYAQSYDHWQFRRWLHEVRPSDFAAFK